MASTKISALAPAVTLTGAETIPLVQAGQTVGGTAAQVMELTITQLQTGVESLVVNTMQSGNTGTPYSSASFNSSKLITTHAWYDYLANGTFQPAGGAPIYGHATFDSNLKIAGSVAIDHHNDYQAYPQFNTSTTVTATAGFFYQPQVDGGTVLEMEGLHVFDALGSTGTINNQFGVKIESLVRGAGNYAIYTAGTTKSQFGGNIQLGVPTTPASIGYDYVSGDTILTPRNDSPVYNIFINSEYLYLGASTKGFAASFRNNAGTGDLEVAARPTFKTRILGALEVVGPVMVGSYTVATLPSAATYPRGHAFVSDANSSTFNAAAVGGGSNSVPVFSDGSIWRVG